MIRLAVSITISFGLAFPTDAQTLNGEGLPLAEDEVIYDHIAYRSMTSVVEIAIFLDQLGDTGRADLIARSRQILERFGPELETLCGARGINPWLAAAMITTESFGRTEATSPVGARGLMQLMPGTASDLDVLDSTAAADNIFGGCRYLAQMLDVFGDDEIIALAAYNAGPGAVRRHEGVPPYNETRAYIIRVARAWPEEFSADDDTSSTSPSQAAIDFVLSPRE